MNTITKSAIGLSTVLALSTFFASGVFAASMDQGTAMWKSVPKAKWYNIYYKSSPKDKHAVRQLRSDAIRYTIGGLKPGVTYTYKVAALDDNGREFWWSAEQKLFKKAMK